MQDNIPAHRKLTEFLSNNKAVIIQTDTVYGILALDESLIIRAKRREHADKKTIRFVHHRSQISPDIPKDLVRLLDKYWPGELTVIYRGIGYRCPNSPHILEALKSLNRFVYASSANITSQPTALTLEEAKIIFGNSEVSIEFVEVEKSETKPTKPSTIYDYDGDRILREGNIKGEEILRERRRSGCL